ncbi:MAG TPA: ribonuclease D [Thermoanaerobaculia bacterium]|nr:ribonuclease D [Thermoanaerobaculia bacterium]
MKWIDTPTTLGPVLESVASARMIGIDTEADSLHSYFDKVCLVQISADEQDFLIDPLAGLDLAPLGAITANPATVKVLHGADYDIRILHRDFGFTFHNLIDTMICAQLLGEKAVGLAALLERYFGVQLDKSHQRADWAMRPLPPRMAEYAAMDTRYLLGLVEILRARLIELGRWEWAEDEFRRLEAIRWSGAPADEERFRRLKGIARFEPRNLEVVSRLYDWRDGMARRLDRPPFKVIGNDALVALAEHLPRNRQELGRVSGVSGYHLAKYGRELLETIETALEVPEQELPEKRRGRPWIRDDQLEKRIRRLKDARDRVAGELNIDPAILAPKHVLAAIVASGVRAPEDLGKIEAMRDWQRRVVGPALLAALR